jgi:serine/threonine protein phosphatase PrpC
MMIPAERSHFHVAAQSNPGMSGKNNEDRYSISAFRLEGDNPLPVVLAIVSDGIGGHRAGEVAAEIAVETISRIVAASDASHPLETLREAIGQASQAILELAESDDEKRGMGATCACAWIIDNRLYAAYVGDSRMYLIRGKRITQLSIDHTWIQEALDAGVLKPDKIKGHPNAHVIRRFLGSSDPVLPDTRLYLEKNQSDEQAEANQGLIINPGDQLILCSDGLTDLVSEDEIQTAFATKDQETAISELIELANQRGGHDNITIVALRMPIKVQEKAAAAPAPVKRRLNPTLTCLTAGAILGVLLVLIGAAYIYFRQPPSSTPTPVSSSTSLSSPSAIILTEAPLPTETSLSFDATPTFTLAPPTSTPSTTPVEATLTPWHTNTTQP